MTYLTCWESAYAQNKIAENTGVKKLDLMQILYYVGIILKVV